MRPTVNVGGNNYSQHPAPFHFSTETHPPPPSRCMIIWQVAVFSSPPPAPVHWSFEALPLLTAEGTTVLTLYGLRLVSIHPGYHVRQEGTPDKIFFYQATGECVKTPQLTI